MGQVKGNPTPSLENAAFEARYPNTGRDNRDLGQIIAPAVEEAIVEVVEEIAPVIEAKPTKKTSAKAVPAPSKEEAPTTEEPAV